MFQQNKKGESSMKIGTGIRRLLLASAMVIVGALSSAASITYEVTLDTGGLIGHVAGPFWLNLQLTDGGGTASNSAFFSDFGFSAGGAEAGTASAIGGASGDMSGNVSLTDSSFLNAFSQQFTAGDVLSFKFTLTTNADLVPDQLSFALLDSTGFEVPTTGLGAIGSDALFIIDIGSTPSIQTFAPDSSRSPWGGGDPIDFSVKISAVPPGGSDLPEPATVTLFACGLLLVGVGRLARKK